MYTTISKSDCFSLNDAYEFYQTMDFNNDPVNLTDYAEKKWESCRIRTIIEGNNENIPLQTQILIRECVANSASVERLFSLLNHLLTSNKTFSTENLISYIRQYNRGSKI